MSNMWFGYKKEELLEAAYGDSHRLKKSSVSTLSVPVCSQGQSQIPHEGKPFVETWLGFLPMIYLLQAASWPTGSTVGEQAQES